MTINHEEKTESARIFHRRLTTDVLARTLWGEAGREGSAIMHAVACVVLNRVWQAEYWGHGWWGKTIVQVCQKPQQFRCWNRDDARFRKILAVDDSNRYFAATRALATRAMDGQLDDITKGATHYHAVGAMPDWAVRRRPTAVVGRIIFYQFSDI